MRRYWQEILTGISFALILISMPFIVSSFVATRNQASEAKMLAHAACVRTKQVAPGFVDFIDFYGTSTLDPRTGKPFFDRAYIEQYRESIPKVCP